MDILRVIKSFPCSSENYKLLLTIGKSISRQCFAINNKIFFDVLKTYLQKNSWFISKQYLSKNFYYRENYLQSMIEKKPSLLLDLDIPITQTVSLYQKKDEMIKRFKGTYFDLFCHGYISEEINDVEQFSEYCEQIYNEVTEEVTLFKKANSSLEIIFSVNKEKEPNIFSVKLSCSTMNDAEQEEFIEVFEIIELAMCKYTKTDKTVSSVFESI